MSVELTRAVNNDALYQVRLLSALRSGECFAWDILLVTEVPICDPAQIHPFLAEIGRDRRTSAEIDVDLGAAALHLAIRCASCK